MKSKKGFTLIELLVVIAIIGILAGIVLVSIRDVTPRAKDAAIKSDLQQIRTQAEIIYSDNASYNDLCTAADQLGTAQGLSTIEADLISQGTTFRCYADGDDYCVSADLLTGSEKTFCIDSNGLSKVYDSGDDCGDPNVFSCD
jgi:prepilin-type N-terminal cleavage/methylation domain-containing protein